MTSFTRGLYIAFAVSSFGSLGCGAAAPEESVAQEREALGWSDLAPFDANTGTYRLTADFDAAGQSWTPMDFSGTFDGGNHTISNLTISGGGFFRFLDNATVKNLRLTNLTVTGSSLGVMGGLATSADDSTIENCSVEANINFNAIAVGGFFGIMTGGSIFRSYAKGTISGTMDFAGGLAGIVNPSEVGSTSISESYAQVTVNPNTSNTSATITAGGLVGRGDAVDIHDAYAVGSVTGRGAVGGIAGALECGDPFTRFYLYKTIYRGQVVDQNWSPNGGWAGAVGTFTGCYGRFGQNFYDRTLDPSSHHAADPGIQGFTTTELRSPTSVIGGVFCVASDPVPGRCGDNTWSSPPWTAGSSSQHHVLLNMPGPNAQPR